MRNGMQPMIILTGPTAVGKTRLSLNLARRTGGEIISADSMQVYRHMDIGSAKITREEMQGIPHHLIDILEPWESFNVAAFQEKCLECMQGIYRRGHIPIVTGGTGFYIQALLKNVDFTENEEDTGYRAQLEQLAAREGAEKLHQMLQEADPEAAEAIHPNNVKRTIRALEYYYLTGEQISRHNRQEREKPPAYNFCYFVLNDNRDRLYERIEQRIDEMLAQGLVEEVRGLKETDCTRDMEAVTVLKRDTRHFAKRQLTWFRRERDVIWVDKEQFHYDEEAILDFMLEKLREQNIIQ